MEGWYIVSQVSLQTWTICLSQKIQIRFGVTSMC